MAEKPHTSIKQLKIDKANTTMFTVLIIAVFVVVFCLIASKVLLGQYSYQNRVISAKRDAVNQLKTNINNIDKLVSSFHNFDSASQNILGGNPAGSSQNDGSNSRIILDALPSEYDFPGFVSGLAKVLSNQGYTLNSITGNDQSGSFKNSQPLGQTSPVKIPFQVSATGPYSSIQKLIGTLQLSIRPIVIQTLSLNGSDNTLTATITGYTYYQPSVNFSLGSKVVK